MIKSKPDNLVTYDVPVDNEGKEYVKLRINTTLLTKIRYSKGERRWKRDTISRRLRRRWNLKHPILSKFYIPLSLWEGDFGYWDSWHVPHISVYYNIDNPVYIVKFKSNELAEQAKYLMDKHFWGDR